MPYQISWHTDNTMLIKLEGDVTLEELQSITDESFALVLEARQKIHAIIDQSTVKSLPNSLKALANGIPRNRHPNQGISILLNPSIGSNFRFLATVFFQVLGFEYRIAKDMEEAEAIIQKMTIQK